MAVTRNTKKGVIFTLMAIVLSSVLLVSTGLFVPQPPPEQDPALLRVRVLDGVVTGFISYAENALRTSTYLALENMTQTLALQPDAHMSLYFTPATFYSNLSTCVLHPEKKLGESAPWDINCLPNQSFPALLDEYIALVNNSLNVDISYTIDNTSYNVWEELPFEASTNLSIEFFVNDSMVAWNMTNITLFVYVPLYGLTDPVTAKFAGVESATYWVGDPYTFASVSSQEFPVWNATAVVRMTKQKLFRAQKEGPSVLGRYIGNFSPSACCGVEAFVNRSSIRSPPWTSAYSNTNLKNYSFVDHELLRNLDTYPSADFKPPVFRCDGGGSEKAYAFDYPAADGDSAGNTDAWPFYLNQTILSRYNVSGWNSC